MPQVTFEVDAPTRKAIGLLRKPYGVTTHAEVIQKALALAQVAQEHADAQNLLTILSPQGARLRIQLDA